MGCRARPKSLGALTATRASASLPTIRPACSRSEDAPPENGDGQRFSTADGHAELAVYASYNIDNETPEDYVANRVDLAGVSYKKIGRDFYAISGTRDASIFYRRCNFPNRDVIACFHISYPEAEKAKWDAIVTRIARSLRRARRLRTGGAAVTSRDVTSSAATPYRRDGSVRRGRNSRERRRFHRSCAR